MEAVENGSESFDAHTLKSILTTEIKSQGISPGSGMGLSIPRAPDYARPRLCGRFKGEEGLEENVTPIQKEGHCSSTLETGSCMHSDTRRMNVFRYRGRWGSHR